MHSTDCRLSLLVQPHPHEHLLIFSGAPYGCGSTSLPPLHVQCRPSMLAARKIKSTIYGDLSHPGISEILNLTRLPYAGLLPLVVHLCLQCTTQNSFTQPSALLVSPSWRMTNSAEGTTWSEKLFVLPQYIGVFRSWCYDDHRYVMPLLSAK